MGLMVEKLGMQSIEIFRTRDELFNRMLDLSIGSQMINTQMFSDPPDEIGGEMEKYFKKLSAHTKKNSSLVFRRIATIGGNNNFLILRLLHSNYKPSKNTFCCCLIQSILNSPCC